MVIVFWASVGMIFCGLLDARIWYGFGMILGSFCGEVQIVCKTPLLLIMMSTFAHDLRIMLLDSS